VASRLAERILAGKSVDIDVVSGASVTSAAVLAAARQAFGQANLASAAYTAPGNPVVINTEIVVVGAGTSGLGAALSAYEAGAQVVVLEQTGAMGGLSNTAMGILATESVQQTAAARAGTIPMVTTEWVFKHLHEYNHYRENAVLLRAILQKSGSTIDWLTAYGVPTILNLGVDQGLHTAYPKTYHIWLESTIAGFSGATQYEQLWDNLRGVGPNPVANPIQIELYTRATKLIYDGNRVTGVEAVRDNGERVIVNAQQVILCTGGFGANAAMFMDYTDINYYNYFGYGNHGDGVNMAWDIGADKIGSHIIQIHMSDLAGTKAIGSSPGPIAQITDLPHFWVDMAGNRFTSEEVIYDNVFWGNAAFAAGGKYYIIFDDDAIQSLEANGAPYLGGYSIAGQGLFDFGGAATGVDGSIVTKAALPPVTGLKANIESLAANPAYPGSVIIAVSLDELAAKTGMNPGKLNASVARYNAAVDAKQDDLFYKPSKYLTYKIQKGPFYAIAMQGSTYGSVGGVRVNEDVQAVRSNGTVIPGLYVAGADSSGNIYDNSYPDYEGLSQAYAMNSGRIAGEHAAAALQR
jgi:fumarate reductase flavoprotein subunit